MEVSWQLTLLGSSLQCTTSVVKLSEGTSAQKASWLVSSTSGASAVPGPGFRSRLVRAGKLMELILEVWKLWMHV